MGVDLRADVQALRDAQADAGWRVLRGTPDAAGRLLRAYRKPPAGSDAAFARMAELLEAFEHAEPDSRRDRAMRQPRCTGQPIGAPGHAEDAEPSM